MKIRSTPWLVILTVLFFSGCSKEKIVGEAGGQKVTATEFRDRFTKYLAATGDRDNILVREKILNNMLNERLIYDDAHMRGFDRDSSYRKRMDAVTGQALLDSYAKSVSVDTIEVSQKELWDEFRNSKSVARARYVYARTHAEARKLKSRLQRGEPFEKIAREVFVDPRLADNGGSVGYISYGDMEANFEVAAFSLPPGVLSDPVRLRVGWAIIRVDDRIETPLLSEMDYAKMVPKLTQAVRERKTRTMIKKVSDDVAAELQPEFNQAAVEALLSNWGVLAEEGGSPSVEELMRRIPADVSHEHLVSFRNSSWTIADAVARAERLPDKYLRKVHTAEDVKDVVVGLAARDAILERAHRAGLDQNESVLHQVNVQRELYLLKRWEETVVDTVRAESIGENEITSYYSQNRAMFVSAPEVNIGEILVRYRTEADSLMGLLRRGAHFVELARRNSIRPWGAKRGGELGYGTRSRFNPFAEKFFSGQAGDLIGPLSVGPFFAIFKILGKKEGHPKSLEGSRNDIVNQLLPAKKRTAYEAALAGLRNRSGISIDMEALGNVVIPRQ
jgi:parvulin-like peptidyl-prolyl isomerase